MGFEPIGYRTAASPRPRPDVARFVELAVRDPAMGGETINVGGTQNLTPRREAGGRSAAASWFARASSLSSYSRVRRNLRPEDLDDLLDRPLVATLATYH